MKLLDKLKQGSTPSRFSTNSARAPIDRREQRKLDQAQGLVSFPLKLKQPVIEEIRTRAAAQNTGTSEIVEALLEKALKL
ncbi:MAG TPA: hypothetical protein VIR04_01940 [Paralcaligenes sp.]